MTSLARLGVLCFEVPLPYRALSPNAEGKYNRFAQGGANSPRQTYRREVAVLAMAAARAEGWMVPARARVGLVFGVRSDPQKERLISEPEWKPYRPEDVPNAVSAAKALFDGLVDGGVILDDNFKVLELGSVVIRPGCGPCVIVTVEAL